jgi:hypothetical protein
MMRELGEKLGRHEMAVNIDDHSSAAGYDVTTLG